MMTREQQIKDYVRDHYKYYGFYPYDVVLNMDTEQEETLTRESTWQFTKVNPLCATNQSGTIVVVIGFHATIIV